MILGQETLGFRREGFSPSLSLLTSAFSLPYAPVHLTIHLQLHMERSPTARLRERTASAACLAPLYLRRRATRPVSYYAFFKGWLLLSQPPGCLGFPTSLTT